LENIRIREKRERKLMIKTAGIIREIARYAASGRTSRLSLMRPRVVRLIGTLEGPEAEIAAAMKELLAKADAAVTTVGLLKRRACAAEVVAACEEMLRTLV
jgi:hypothetical protein